MDNHRGELDLVETIVSDTLTEEGLASYQHYLKTLREFHGIATREGKQQQAGFLLAIARFGIDVQFGVVPEAK